MCEFCVIVVFCLVLLDGWRFLLYGVVLFRCFVFVPCGCCVSGMAGAWRCEWKIKSIM